MKKTLIPLVAMALFPVCMFCNNKTQESNQIDTHFINHLTVENSDGGFIEGEVINIAESKEGKIAVGRENGVMVFEKNTWKIYRMPKISARVFFDGDGKLWTITEGKIFRLEGESFNAVETTFLDKKTITGIAIDNQKRLWLSTDDNGIMIWDGKTFERKLSIDTVSVKKCTGMASLSDGTILIATETDLFWYDGNVIYRTGIPPYFYPIECARVWKVSQDILMVDIGQDGPDKYIYCEDKWTGTSDDARDQISSSAVFLNASISDAVLQGFRSNSSKTIFYFDSKNNIWEAKNPPGLLYRWRCGSEKVVPVMPDVGLPTNVINDLCNLNGRTYIATPYGLFESSAGKYKPIYTEDGVSNVKSVGSKIWALSVNKLICINNDSFNIYIISTDNEKYIFGSGHALHIFHDSVYVQASGPNKYYIYSLNKWDTLTLPSKKNDFICDIERDSSNTLYFAMLYNGIWQCKNNTWTNYTTTQGLQSNGVYGLARDANGKVWYSSFKGIGFIRNDEIHQYTGENAQYFTGNYINIFPDENIGIWITADSAVYHISNDKTDKYPRPDSQGRYPWHIAAQDAESNLWIACWGAGIYVLKP